jgi:hypothetical protein
MGLTLIGEAPAVRLVVARHDADPKLWVAEEEIVHRRSLIYAHEDKGRRKADGAERTHGHADVALPIARCDDGNAGRKATQEPSEGIGVDHAIT